MIEIEVKKIRDRIANLESSIVIEYEEIAEFCRKGNEKIAELEREIKKIKTSMILFATVDEELEENKKDLFKAKAELHGIINLC